jgi:hypothetical protein
MLFPPFDHRSYIHWHDLSNTSHPPTTMSRITFVVPCSDFRYPLLDRGENILFGDYSVREDEESEERFRLNFRPGGTNLSELKCLQ